LHCTLLSGASAVLAAVATMAPAAPRQPVAVPIR